MVMWVADSNDGSASSDGGHLGLRGGLDHGGEVRWQCQRWFGASREWLAMAMMAH